MAGGLSVAGGPELQRGPVAWAWPSPAPVWEALYLGMILDSQEAAEVVPAGPPTGVTSDVRGPTPRRGHRCERR